MGKEKISTKTAHKLPSDFKKAIASNHAIQKLWDSLTPLARNEWVCWVVSGKMEKTRGIRIEKAVSKMKTGMRRPCCWMGCPHRRGKPISLSAQAMLNRHYSRLK